MGVKMTVKPVYDRSKGLIWLWIIIIIAKNTAKNEIDKKCNGCIFSSGKSDITP